MISISLEIKVTIQFVTSTLTFYNRLPFTGNILDIFQRLDKNNKLATSNLPIRDRDQAFKN